MLPRIRDHLNEFLKPYDLNMSSRIFEDSIPILANLEISEPKKTGFHFTKKLSSAGCRFIAPKFDEVNKSKLINFCGIIEVNDANKGSMISIACRR